MIISYLKTAWRNLWRHRSYAVLNTLGLAAGMTCGLLIVLYVTDELSFDRYHEHRDRIFRLVDTLEMPNGLRSEMALSSAAFAPRLLDEFPEVEAAARIFSRRRMVELGDKKFYEDDLFYADEALFRVFSFPLIRGNPADALAAPQTVVLSRTTAQKYFGETDPMDRSLKIEGQDYLVTGIMEDMPRNSHFRASLFVSLKTLEQIPGFRERYLESWARHEFYTYLLLREGAESSDVDAKLPGFIERHAAEQIRGILGGTLSSRLQPLARIYLHSHLSHEVRPTSDIKYIYIFTVVGFFILLIACTNYMNLATARSVSRAREVGLRKVLGARGRQLVGQFLGESFLLSLIALALTLALVRSALPAFNQLAGKGLAASRLLDPALLAGAGLLFVIVGLAAGSYPSFYISRFLPADVFRGRGGAGSGGRALRRGLVALQFGISMLLIVATGVVVNQLDYLRNRKLGFDKQHVVVVPVRSARIRREYEALKAELAMNPNILGSTFAIGVPGGQSAGDAIKLLSEKGSQTLTLSMIYADHDYIRVMGMEIIEGRDFSRESTTDATDAFIINEAAASELQLENALAARFEWGDQGDRFYKNGRVIGVVKDFAFQSLKDEIRPFVIHIHPANAFSFAIRVRPAAVSETLTAIEAVWRKWDPAHPFEYSFLDENFDRLYRGEERLGRIFRIFSGLAVLIAALGLFGLALFTVQRRTREIGIRKVLGASSSRIFWLITRDYARLVLIAGLAAWPTAFFVMRGWLDNFAYRTGIGFGVFLLSAGIVLAASLVTVSWHSLRAASANPADSLRRD